MLPVLSPVEGAPANVTISRGLTLSMGANTYEFSRVDVTISMPCTASPEAVEKTRLAVTQEVERLTEIERIRIKGNYAERLNALKSGDIKLADIDAKSRPVFEAALKG